MRPSIWKGRLEPRVPAQSLGLVRTVDEGRESCLVLSGADGSVERDRQRSASDAGQHNCEVMPHVRILLLRVQRDKLPALLPTGVILA